MRWCTYRSSTDGAEHPGLVEEGAVRGLPSERRVVDLLGGGRAALAEAAEEARSAPLEVVPLEEARLLAPVPVPPSFRDFMAFEEHVANAGKAFGHGVPEVWYEMPIFYFSNPAAIRGPWEDVPVAPGSEAFDYELEVGVVVGSPGSDLSPSEAEQHIGGLVVLCDWSARDIQRSEMRGNLGPAKGKDTATSLGPWIVTPDELEVRRAGKAYDLGMKAFVNGEQWSEGNLSSIHWSFGQMLAYASRGTELRPGDILGTGTVGTGCILELSALHGPDPYRWLRPGDRVRLEVEELGSIDSRIVGGSPVVPLQ